MAGQASQGAGRTLSRDFKHVRRHAPGTPGQPFSGWVGLCIGLGLGLSVALAVHVHYRNLAETPAEPVPVPAQPPASATATDESSVVPGESTPTPPDFDFYDMLPKQEVEVPASQRAGASRGDAPANSMPSGDVVLQAGSFKQSTEAEKMVANLALYGIESKIQRASVEDETWYRVRIGPIATVDDLERIRAKLAEAEINAPPVTPVVEAPLP
jgi:cell division septation protein DedD